VPVDIRVARFFLTPYTKTGKNIPNYHNITKWQKTVPNRRKIFQLAIKYTNIFHSKALQNLFAQIGIFVLKNTTWQPWATEE
jgi:hypothetical protein